MIQLPGQVVSGYRSHLMKRRVKEEDFADYLKWLRYFHDFCEKYCVVGDEIHRVRLFLDKLREKNRLSSSAAGLTMLSCSISRC